MSKAIIAVAGKGGVGKTSIAAAIVAQLVRDYPEARILAIDADPAVGLETSLGVKTRYTVDDIRKEIAKAGEGDKEKHRAIELLGESRFRLLDAMVETEGFAFLAIGRPEAAGCYCSVNTYLREVISAWAGEFDYVVIDGEAGVEQINRRVMEKVSHLLLVSDPSRKGTQVIRTVLQVADELTMYQHCGAIINRMNDPSLEQFLKLEDIPLLSYIRDDPELALADVQGRSVMDLPADGILATGVRRALSAIGIT
ncbi:MAG: AAA family ATPase [Oscillospiraceae bacterium]